MEDFSIFQVRKKNKSFSQYFQKCLKKKKKKKDFSENPEKNTEKLLVTSGSNHFP